MPGKQENWGVTVLVLEKKRIENAEFLEALVLQGKKWRPLDNANLMISLQIHVGLFSEFLQLISLFQVKLASQKDNWKSCIPHICRKIPSHLRRNSKKIKTSHV